MESPPRVESSGVTNQVYQALLRRIMAGEFAPYSRLPQEALADELGVSRTPLREALRRLASEGFVDFAVNHGATVSGCDLSQPDAVQAARLHFEPAVAHLAAGVRDRVGLEALGCALGPGAPDPAALRAADAAFHTAVATVTANSYLIRFAQMLWMTRPAAGAYAGGGALLTPHAAIAAAIEHGDAAEAERLSRDHVALV
jgi:DNA-binding GntR family transcriptional regulator